MKEDSKHVACCDTVQIHPELIDRISHIMPEEEVLYDLAELFKVFGDTQE